MPLKGALCIGLLLLICGSRYDSYYINLTLFPAEIGYSSSVIAKRGATMKDPKPFIDKLNSGRKKYAIKYNIANMHEISYDKDLEKQAIEFTCDYATPFENSHAPINDPNTLEESDFSNRVSPDDRETGDDWRAFVVPDQTRVGCAGPDDKCGGRCFIGPLKRSRDSAYLKGPLGSQCTYGKGPSGLCLSSEKSQAIIRELEQKERNFSEEDKTSEREQNGAKFSEAKADIDIDKSSSCSFLFYFAIAFTFFMV